MCNFFSFRSDGEGKNPFQSAIDLWDAGLVPSYDGTTWRLHAGREAKIVYEAKL